MWKILLIAFVAVCTAGRLLYQARFVKGSRRDAKRV